MSSARADLGLSTEEEREEARQYVLARIEKNGDCWDWKLNKLHAGHGQAKWRGYPRKAHRLSYQAFKGPTGDKCVCHTCDRPCCVNPDHLFLGTKGDNNRDAFAKDRYGIRGMEDVTPDMELAAFFMSDNGIPQSRIAKAFGLKLNTVVRLFRRRRKQQKETAA